MITSIINFLLVATLVFLLVYRFAYETEFKWHVNNIEEDLDNFLSKHLFSKKELKEYKKAKDEIKYQQFKAKIPNFDSTWW